LPRWSTDGLISNDVLRQTFTVNGQAIAPQGYYRMYLKKFLTEAEVDAMNDMAINT